MESLLFTREDLKKLIVPLIIEQALALSIGLFDTLMVSSCGEAAVSGVSLVDSISTLLIQILSALATGGAVVCSQYIGKKMPERAKLSAGQLMFIMLMSAGTVMVVILLSYRFLLRAIFGQIDADVMQNAEIYFIISAIPYPFLGVYNAGAALFRAIGNSKVSMYTSLVMNVINIGGNAVLIFGLKMGVLGAALATLTARIVSALVMVVLLSRKDNPLLGLAYAGMVLADLALFALVKPIIACFALSAEAARIATQLLVSFAICAALIWPLSFTLPNVLRAAGDAKYTMEVSVFSMWVFRVASSYFFAGTMGLGVLGVWIGMYVDWGFRTLLFLIRYRRGKWLEKRVV